MNSHDEVQIVQLSPQQWQAYKALRLRALQEDPQAFGASYAEHSAKPDSYWQERLEAVGNGKNWFVFAKMNESLVGMMGGFKRDDDPENTVNVIAVYVAKEFRGRGIAKRLMDSLISEFLKDLAITKLRLAVNKNQLPAVNLYRGFGFTIVGETNTLLGDGNYYDEYLMEKEL